MTRALVAVALALAVVAAVLAAAVALDDDNSSNSAPAGNIQARLVLAPRVVNFADTITARIEVVFDRAQIDPDSVRVSAEFTPWTSVRAAARTIRDDGPTRFVETTYVLRCLTQPCAPRRQSASLEFNAVRVAYMTSDGSSESIQRRWPVLVVNSRIVPDDFQREDELARPWRADLASLPRPTYRIAPGLLLALLLAGAGALGLVGVFLIRAALPPRRAAVEPPPPPPERELTPVERALVLLENGLPSERAGERRQALERLANELAAHDARLAGEASALAWAASPPPAEQARRVAAQARPLLVQEEQEEEEEEEKADAPA